nr:MAG TPA: hypothetical protein [Caudoviricetes sp.]
MILFRKAEQAAPFFLSFFLLSFPPIFAEKI